MFFIKFLKTRYGTILLKILHFIDWGISFLWITGVGIVDGRLQTSSEWSDRTGFKVFLLLSLIINLSSKCFIQMTEDLDGFQFKEGRLTNLTHSFLSSECVSSLGKWKDGTFSFTLSSWLELSSHASAVSLFFSVYPDWQPTATHLLFCFV